MQTLKALPALFNADVVVSTGSASVAVALEPPMLCDVPAIVAEFAPANLTTPEFPTGTMTAPARDGDS